MKRLVFLIPVLVIISGCWPVKEAQSTADRLASMYNPSEFSLNADYRLYHISDDMTSLFIRLYPGELLFNQANPEGEYRAVVQINYAVYELDDAGALSSKIDSAELVFKLDRRDQERSAYFASKVLNIEAGSRYLIRLDSKDLQRGTVGLEHLVIDKRNKYAAQNFSVVSPRSGYPKFLNFFVPGEVFKVLYRDFGLDSIYLDFYRDKEYLPRPPLTQNSKSFYPMLKDTTIVLAYSDSLVFTLPDKGLYHFRIDTNREEGLSLLNFGPDFPQIKTDEQLLEPLFYISTLTEYKRLAGSANLKLAIDDFWLERAESIERSRELIRIYYNRVLYSNIYFTSHQEGWKTDRGLVFILFGPPNRMRDTGSEQIWYYISRRQGKVIEFVFERKQSRFSNQNLEWKKNPETLGYWSQAVSSWRKGKVYALNN